MESGGLPVPRDAALGCSGSAAGAPFELAEAGVREQTRTGHHQYQHRAAASADTTTAAAAALCASDDSGEVSKVYLRGEEEEVALSERCVDARTVLLACSLPRPDMHTLDFM